MNVSGLQPSTKYELVVLAQSNTHEEASEVMKFATFGERE